MHSAKVCGEALRKTKGGNYPARLIATSVSIGSISLSGHTIPCLLVPGVKKQSVRFGKFRMQCLLLFKFGFQPTKNKQVVVQCSPTNQINFSQKVKRKPKI